MTSSVAFALLLFAGSADEAGARDRATTYRTAVAPLLAKRCLTCHEGLQAEAGLDLSWPAAEDLRAYGERVVVAGDAAASRLVEMVESGQMPPRSPLPEDERAVLRRWVADGAYFDEVRIDPRAFTTSSRAGRDFWSLQPIVRAEPPSVEHAERVRTPVDRFLLARLEAEGRCFAPDAPPRTQVRRLWFDLIGLPPPYEVVRAFEKDPSDARWAAMVDELLASRAHAERYARHWLDVVRFGESDGFERNAPRENAWPYRDWVVDALHQDLRYDEFARMQIAGDLLRPDTREGLAASSFLVAGLHNTVVGASEEMQKRAREDETEERVGVVSQTFLGLTLHCARCHDHKYDPVTQHDYTAFAALLGGVEPGERELADPGREAKVAELDGALDVRAKEIADLEARARDLLRAAEPPAPAESGPLADAEWDFEKGTDDLRGRLPLRLEEGARVEDGALVLDGTGGYAVTDPLPDSLLEKTLCAWVVLEDLEQRGGAALSVESLGGERFDAIVFGEQEPRHWMAGSDFFRRTRPFGGAPESRAHAPVCVCLVLAEDGTVTAYRDGERYGTPYFVEANLGTAPGEARVLLGLRHSPPTPGKFLRGKVLRAALFGWALSAEEVAVVTRREPGILDAARIAAVLSPDDRDRLLTLRSELEDLRSRREGVLRQPVAKVYTVTPKDPGPRHRFVRGDPMVEAEVVAPASVQALDFEPFELPADCTDAERRVALARWITARDNPRFARVMVNRVWQAHLGQGLVDTPSDFGFQAGAATNRELLDWLASEFEASGMSLRALHRTIVCSSAYRQSSRTDEASREQDPDARLLGRRRPTRLDAETLRDSLLSVADVLEDFPGGPGFRDVSVTYDNGTTYYEPLATDDPATWHRTLYRFTPRGGRSALLDTFDCPDPSSPAPKRTVTTTPLQALSLANDPFVLHMARHFAARIEAQSSDTRERVQLAYRLSLARDPEPEECDDAAQLLEEHGAFVLARALFNLSEFTRVE